MRCIAILILDKYLDDSKIEISFNNSLTKSHVKELLFFKDMDLPDYLKLFYEQTDGLLIESYYLQDDLEDPRHLLINSLADLFFTTKKLNKLPERRFIHFATNDEDANYLLDMENLDPNRNPLILLSVPAYKQYIPLTNNFDIFLESSCIGLLGMIEQYSIEQKTTIEQITKKMRRKKERVLFCLKNLFETSKREYELLDIWYLPLPTKKIVQFSIANWLKEIKRLLGIFQEQL